MRLFSRLEALRLSGCATLPLLLFGAPPAAFGEDGGLSSIVRRAVVRSAQIADLADSAWQQVAGEVVPAWQAPQQLSPEQQPPAFLDEAFTKEMLSLPLEAAAQSLGDVSRQTLASRLPAARQEAVLLYEAGGPGGGAEAAGTALRVFPRALATAVADAASEEIAASNATIFNFEMYIRWRVLQAALSDGREPAERARLQRSFTERLGTLMLRGPLRGAAAAAGEEELGRPRRSRSLRRAVDGCTALLARLQEKGLFSKASLQLTLGSGTDLFDEGDWQAGGSTSFQYIISGSSVVGGSQLAQDRTAATGQGAGLYPGQLLSAPLAAYLREAGIDARIDEYFLDNRVGRPDPRQFSDQRYYSDVLLEVVALAEP